MIRQLQLGRLTAQALALMAGYVVQTWMSLAAGKLCRLKHGRFDISVFTHMVRTNACYDGLRKMQLDVSWSRQFLASRA